MTKLVRFKNVQNGQVIAVNPAHVVVVIPANENAILRLANGDTYTVSGSMEAVMVEFRA